MTKLRAQPGREKRHPKPRRHSTAPTKTRSANLPEPASSGCEPPSPTTNHPTIQLIAKSSSILTASPGEFLQHSCVLPTTSQLLTRDHLQTFMTSAREASQARRDTKTVPQLAWKIRTWESPPHSTSDASGKMKSSFPSEKLAAPLFPAVWFIASRRLAAFMAELSPQQLQAVALAAMSNASFLLA